MFSLMRRRPARTEAALTRRVPDPLLVMREEMESLFDRFFGDWTLPEEWAELREWETEAKDTEVVMRLELPGFEAREIELRREGNVLVLRAEHPEVAEGKEAARRPMERYEYRLTLPFGTDAEHIAASYRNGVLEVHFPRLPEVQPRRIEVTT